MTDSQFGILISVLASFGASTIAMLKWSVGRITKALDDNSASNKLLADGQLEQAKAFQELSTKVQFAFNAAGAVKDFMVEERSGVHDAYEEQVETPPAIKRRTPPRGVYGPMPKKKEDE